MNLTLRLETPSDYRAVEELTREAFWGYTSPTCDEHYLVHLLRQSPAFVPELDYVAEANGRLVGNIIYTKAKVAVQNKQICAFLKVVNMGETFVTPRPDTKHINSAFCLPKHRGKGVYQNLLNYTISTLATEGYARLGVDFESFNPTAYSSWQKYFQAYTHSVVRRIDERIL
jgi:GNAT superfamily N-acetyltransferase